MRELEFPIYPVAAGPRLRWGAVIAGAAMAMAVTVALNVLGVGLRIFPGAGPAAAPAAAIGLSASWWSLGAGIAAYAAGGWFASRLSDCGRRADGVLYGLVTWAAATLASVYAPAFALGGGAGVTASGIFAFATLALQAGAAALGGAAGGRLYLPVPIAEYRRHREAARS